MRQKSERKREKRNPLPHPFQVVQCRSSNAVLETDSDLALYYAWWRGLRGNRKFLKIVCKVVSSELRVNELQVGGKNKRWERRKRKLLNDR